MPMKTTPHPTLPYTLTFDPVTHTYSDGTDAPPYTSATGFVHTLFPPFDAPAAARRIAARTGKTELEIMAEWTVKRDGSADAGSRAHAYAESLVLGTPAPAPETDADRRTFRIIDKALVMLRPHYEFLGAEQIVFDPLFRLAGTIDLPARNKATGALAILDWKTCEDITDDAYGRTALPPLAHIPDSKVAHYSLQLSLYAWILAHPDYSAYPTAGETVELALIHLPHVGHDPVWRPMIYRPDDITTAALAHVERIEATHRAAAAGGIVPLGRVPRRMPF